MASAIASFLTIIADTIAVILGGTLSLAVPLALILCVGNIWNRTFTQTPADQPYPQEHRRAMSWIVCFGLSSAAYGYFAACLSFYLELESVMQAVFQGIALVVAVSIGVAVAAGVILLLTKILRAAIDNGSIVGTTPISASQSTDKPDEVSWSVDEVD